MPKSSDPLAPLRSDPEAAALLSDPSALESLLKSREAQALAGMFRQFGGAGLQQAAQAAAAGDPAALQTIVSKVMEQPGGAKAMADIQEKAKGNGA